ncbi:Vacuolar protein 8 [Blyttiomyces sp. JEL0837]|nr:Vacuolar protein 8 [Blyttiomyces sp. JEL0837]
MATNPTSSSPLLPPTTSTSTHQHSIQVFLNGFLKSIFCCASCRKPRTGSLYEPLLDTEREAVADLLHFLENRDETEFFQGEPLRALCALTYSDNVDLQRSAALAFVEITEKDVRPVDSGALEPLIRLMESSNPEVQCNAVGCITNLATHDENKTKIARSGALIPLTRLAKSKDLRVQRNATGALLNMTHTMDNRQQLVTAGAIPVLVNLLNSPDYDVQYYCTTSLSNIAVDAQHRRRLATSEPTIVPNLIRLTDSPSLKVQCQAALALRNLASDEKFQLDLVAHNGLQPLSKLLRSRVPQIVLAAAACIRNISIHPQNETPIVREGFLEPLLDLLSYDNEEIQCHAMSTIRNLCSGDENKIAMVEAGAVDKLGGSLRLESLPLSVQGEMTACVAVLALLDEIKPTILKLLRPLIRHTSSPSIDVKANSAAAIGNLAAKLDSNGVLQFLKEWNDIRGYLYDFVSSEDPTLQHIAVWTLIQFVTGDERLRLNVERDESLLTVVQDLTLIREGQQGVNGGGDDGNNNNAAWSADLSQTLMAELRRPGGNLALS